MIKEEVFPLLLFFFITSGFCIKVKDATYELRTADIFGIELGLAEVTVTSDEDLYVWDPYVCTPTTCNPTPPECPPCNYADPDNCGNAVPPCTCDQTKCTDLFDNGVWTEVKLGTTYEILSPENGYSFFYRYYHSDPCKGFRIKYDSFGDDGRVKFTHLDFGDYLDSHGAEWDFSGSKRQYRHVCPSDEFFKPGTFGIYFSQGDFLTRTHFNFTLETFDVETLTPTPCNNIADHTCISNGERLNGTCEVNTKLYYTYESPGCELIALRINLRYSELFTSAQWATVSASFDTPKPDYNSIPPYSIGRTDLRSSDTLIIFSDCSGPKTLYITVECFAFNPFYLTLGSNSSNWSPIQLNNLTLWDAPFRQRNAFHFELPSKTIINCNSFFGCDHMWPTHPSFPQIYYPLLAEGFLSTFLTKFELQNIKFHNFPVTKVAEDYELLSPSVSNTKQLKTNVLMYYTRNGKTVNILSESELQKGKFKLNGIISNIHGEGLTGEYSLRKLQYENRCDYDSFSRVSALYSQILKDYKATNYKGERDAFYIPLRFYAMKYHPVIHNCINYVENLFEKDHKEVKIQSTSCLRTIDDPEYDLDPCCNPIVGWKNGCEPKDITIHEDILSIKEDDSLLNECSNSKCVETYLEDYEKVVINNECDQVINMFTDKVKYTIQVMRDCKLTVFGDNENMYGPTFCATDSDCPDGVLCDLPTNSCPVQRIVQEEQYFTCIVDSLDPITRADFLRVVNQTDSAGVFQFFKEATFFYPYCLRSHGRGGIYYKEKNIGGGTCGCSVTMLDFSEVFEIDTCFNDCFDDFWYSLVPGFFMHLPTCGMEQICNWNENLCNGLDPGSCAAACNLGDACMLRLNEDHYIEFPNITDPVECANTVACVAPEPQRRIKTNDVGINLSPTTCNATYSKCDYYCVDPVCKSSINPNGGVCFNTLDEITCNNLTGTFNDGICYFDSANNLGECTSINNLNTFASCTSLTIQQCLECSGGGNCFYSQNAPKCHLEIFRECDQSECQNAGKCKGQEYLVDSSTGRYGGCIFSKLEPRDVDVVNYCAFNEKPYGKDCIDLSIGSPSICTTEGGTWVYPSTSIDQCHSFEGCYEPFLDKLYSTLYIEGFSLKTKNNCIKSGGNWKPMFNWIPARWVAPSIRNLEWTAKTSYPLDEFVFPGGRPAFNMLYEVLVINNVGSSVGLSLQSDMLCKYSQLENVLSAVTCDCLSDSENCFSDYQSVPTTTGQTCGLQEKTLIGTFYTISFSEDSIPVGNCPTISASTISTEWFKSEKITLASSFAHFEDPEKFPVYNTHDVIVGALLNDGIDIAISGIVNHFQLCFTINENIYNGNHNKYLIYDLGVPDITENKVKLLNLEVTKVDNKICSIVNINSAMNTSTHYLYFPIIRQENFDSTQKTFFSKSTEGMLYTLGALFLFCSVFGVSFVALSLYYNLTSGEKLKLNLLVLIGSLLTFNIIRCLYFFLVISGISSSTLDYILVVLPTFLYFTAFSQIMIIWIILNTQSISIASNYNKLISVAVLITNVVLYSLFIIIVVVFDVSKETEPNQCGSRFINETSNSVQSAVSLVYAIIIAFFFLVIGAISFIFGFKLHKQMEATSKALNMSSSSSSGKTLHLAFVTLISFLLHCIFILVMVSISRPVVIFNFISIVITEVFPSLYIYYSQYIFTFSAKKNINKKNINIGNASSTTTTSGTSSTTTGFSSTREFSSSTELNTKSEIEEI